MESSGPCLQLGSFPVAFPGKKGLQGSARARTPDCGHCVTLGLGFFIIKMAGILERVPLSSCHCEEQAVRIIKKRDFPMEGEMTIWWKMALRDWENKMFEISES